MEFWDFRRAAGAMTEDLCRQSLVMVDPYGDDQPIVYATPYFYEYTLFSPEQVIGRNCRFLQGPSTDINTVSRIKAALSAAEHVHVNILNYRADGSPFMNFVDIQPVFDSKGQLSAFISFQNPIPDQTAKAAKI